MDNNGNRVEPLQALRGIAFLGIFLAHAGCTVSWSHFGVSIFFVLSGFLLARNHYDEQYNCGFTENIKYSWDKIKKLYPLHVVTTLFVAAMLIAQYYLRGNSIVIIFKQLFFNLALVQSCIPNSEFSTSLNGVAWFLSCMAFLYFMYPCISTVLRKISDKNKIPLYYIFVYLTQIMIGIFLYYIIGYNDYFTNLTYTFPLFRLFDFVLGLLLGYYVVSYAQKHQNHINKIGGVQVIYLKFAFS